MTVKSSLMLKLVEAVRETTKVIYSPNDLEVRGPVEIAPRFPVVLSKGVLNGDNGVFVRKALVEIGQLLVGDPLGWVGVRILCTERQ